MGRYVYLPFRITGRKRFWRIAYPAQRTSSGRYPQPPPDIREYQTPVPYIIEGIIVILLCMGFWMGRRSAFLWLTASWVACDAFIHLVMGFGLNEVYIMAAHWAFIIPVCIGYIIRNCKEKYLPYLRGTLAVITIFLFFYNSTLIFEYLTR